MPLSDEGGNLWLLLGFTSALCLGPESGGTYDYTLVTTDSPNLEGQVKWATHVNYSYIVTWYEAKS
jgi:hypothetical protein